MSFCEHTEPYIETISTIDHVRRVTEGIHDQPDSEYDLWYPTD